ncbi:MAG TPA: hypothetical protein PLV78_07940 [Deltaproteobacteria bacterium]|nr:hypothetical protein [Deltaproteobacteria bacterium]
MKSPSEKAILRVVVVTGISSIVTQLYTLREFLTLFAGNEYVIALIIFNWLVLGGLGTMAARFPSRATPVALGFLTSVLAALPTVQLLAVRYLHDMVFVHGSSPGFYPTYLFILFTTMPYALLVGFVLPYSLFTLRGEMPHYPGTRIYIVDNVGDVTGGALFSFALVYLLTPMKALFVVNLMLLVAACLLLSPLLRTRLSIVVCAAVVMAINMAGVVLENNSLCSAEGKLVHYEETMFGRLVVQKSDGQYTLFEDGVPVFSTDNTILAEEAVHYPLSQVENPNDVLIISSVAGMMGELEKYSLEKVDYVQLDPAVSAVEFRFGLLRTIKGLQVINGDGRSYVRDTASRYDAIIINLPEPETFQVNRFFTNEFFSLAQARLRPQGILSFSVSGFDNYLAEPHRQKISSLYNTVRDRFSHVTMLPGEKVYFLCSNSPVSDDIPELLGQKGIETAYIHSYFYGNINKGRIDYLAGSIDASTPRNTDMSPFMMRIMYAQWFAKYSTSPYWFTVIICGIALFYFSRITREEFVLFTTGATTMGAEILVIFIFQILYGYIYLKVGLIVTVFLAGLLPGALLGQKIRNKSRKFLLLTDAGLIVCMALVIMVLHYGGQSVPQALFYSVALCISVLCGFQFPIALALRGGDNPAAIRTFSADLTGAASGVFIMSAFMIPYAGILWATLGLIVLKCTSIMVVGMSHGKDQQASISVL